MLLKNQSQTLSVVVIECWKPNSFNSSSDRKLLKNQSQSLSVVVATESCWKIKSHS